MFRYHTSQFGSCAMEIHKTLCYFFAGINIFLALDLLTEYLDDIFAIFEDRTLANLDQDEAVEHSVVLAAFGFVVGPALANIVLAILLIVGVYQRRPMYVRIFRSFIFFQMVVVCILSVFSYKVILEHESSYIIMLLVLAITIALFGAEAWIAGDYYKLLMEEIHHENLQTIGYL
ncbi:uncharacterized protein LOC120422436 isoform X1 [Culex pipiens pallens]|uniref:uncharacterized protein LOC120422436 isoform X1 n=1 Tax=Culex pipiens pallens TaxID=42434 RepID=UPI001954B747|nr:uncharacterized protein LOC120422436 isoform X1 [Culex pipiens pallens]XP_039441796.1 uncharacterized protein LOC120422436 isoform X1 [Culex pipiens pallens]XP_039441797.1 uncharacterized protein LOC120422436 isoform X1 [Culex pipiens pallens]XP_039441798.1 uncharacterized protein LOC120422436 isoform X1 [Culex pipiens pallens]